MKIFLLLVTLLAFVDIDGNTGVVGHVDVDIVNSEGGMAPGLAALINLQDSDVVRIYASELLRLQVGRSLVVLNYTKYMEPSGEWHGYWTANFTLPSGEVASLVDEDGNLIADLRSRPERPGVQGAGDCDVGGTTSLQLHTVGTSPSGYITVGKVLCCCPTGCYLQLIPAAGGPSSSIIMDYNGVATYPVATFGGNLSTPGC